MRMKLGLCQVVPATFRHGHNNALPSQQHLGGKLPRNSIAMVELVVQTRGCVPQQTATAPREPQCVTVVKAVNTKSDQVKLCWRLQH